jgi:hypothetical protein
MVTILSVPMTVSAATDTQIMNTVSKYMTPQYAINPTKPMVNEQTNAANIYIYKLPTNPVAYVFTSSAAIDCDGQASYLCNNDPTNLGQTSFTQTNGKPLAPATLPWYVLPETPNPIFDYANLGIQGGQAGLVLYDNKMEYGVFGDERGRDVGNSAGTTIGEVSYAMAVSLGIPSNPDTGGVDNGVTYILFTSKENVVSPIESHSAADTIGTSALNIMMSQLGTPVVTSTPSVTPTPVVTSTPSVTPTPVVASTPTVTPTVAPTPKPTDYSHGFTKHRVNHRHRQTS